MPKKPSADRYGKKVGKKIKPDAAVQDGKVSVGAKVPEELLLDMRDLSTSLTRQRGKRVTMGELTEEAIRDLLAKYRR